MTAIPGPHGWLRAHTDKAGITKPITRADFERRDAGEILCAPIITPPPRQSIWPYWLIAAAGAIVIGAGIAATWPTP